MFLLHAHPRNSTHTFVRKRGRGEVRVTITFFSLSLLLLCLRFLHQLSVHKKRTPRVACDTRDVKKSHCTTDR